MQQLRHEEEEHPLSYEPSTVHEEEEEEMLAEELQEERRTAAQVEVRRSLPLGLAQGALAAWVMTELGRIGNAGLQIDGKNGLLLYIALGGIAGLAAATGRRNTAWSATGMAAGVLVSPPLLDWLIQLTHRSTGPMPFAESSLVLVAAMLLGAFTWLRKWSLWKAAWVGAAGYWVIDYLFNLVRMPVGYTRELWDAAWVSAEHGFLVGGALAILRGISQTLLDWRTRWIDRATEWTLERLRQTKDA
jgi:hypothetical protein